MDIYNTNSNKSKTASKPRNKKIGLIVLSVWIFSLIFFILLIRASVSSGPLYNTVGSITAIAVFLLLPVWGFLLGNKLVKILTTIPTTLVVLFYLIYLFILRPHKTTGSSMQPNFVYGEYILSEKVTYYFNSPKRGDVIVFAPPSDVSNGEFFARIIGLPGEYISIQKWHVYINNKILIEPYIDKAVVTNSGPFIGEANILIPEGSYVVLGDNREHSNDSRNYGFIQKSSIKGRFFYIYWPQSRKGLVKNPLETF